MSAYKKLFKYFGSDAAIAKAFGIKRQAMTYWKENGVPTKRAKQAQKVTKGAISVVDILEG